jgi:antitoxin ParD1/3/4
MPALETLRIEVSAEVSEIIEEAVGSGQFASASEMVSSALVDWKTSRLGHGYTAEELKQFIDEAEASGEPIDGKTAMRKIQSELEDYIARRATR